MKFPQIKLSTLIILNILAAGILWLNLKDAVLATDEFIIALGWPNDAVMMYQEEWHKVRSGRGLNPGWGEVLPARLASNIVLGLSALAAAYWVLERKSASKLAVCSNTKWVLAAVFSMLLALNIVKHSSGLLEGPGYGAPFLCYSFENFSLDQASGPWVETEWMVNHGWHIPNTFANICVAAWVLLATYTLCQKIFAKKVKGAPASLPAKKEAPSATG